MSRAKRTFSRFEDMLEIPKEITSNELKVTIVGFKQMLIENYKGILEYEDILIRIKTSMGILNITGFGLNLNQMTGDDILVTGKIESIELESLTD